jgi:hypothetical protein
MQIFHIPTTVLLNLFLIFSTEIREFCCFYDDIPDESFFSRFKTTFESDIADLFNSMVPKTLISEVNRMKSYAKVINNKQFNPYAAAYKNMPKFVNANHSIKLDFVNGHFGYFYKFGLVTNSKIGDLEYDVEGIPLCPLDKTPFKAEGLHAEIRVKTGNLMESFNMEVLLSINLIHIP